MQYVLGIDQSTQGTKAILVDEEGIIIGRADRSHEQIINEQGWVSHNLEEIYQNVLLAVQDVVEKTGINKDNILTIGISNQRETTAIWEANGKPLNKAIVWQCSRAKDIAANLQDHADLIKKKTGLQLSPYFPAAKMTWLLKNTPGLKDIQIKDIRLGTMDSWLIYRMTHGKFHVTDYSNASRTQLFDIQKLCWDEEICNLFQVPMNCLPQVHDSDSEFGETDLEGFFTKPIPIHSALGDSHAALFGQGCHKSGMTKTTYGTGSSIMMNTGENCVASRHGLVTSLAWGIHGKVNYVLEGNINYTGAVITWLKDDVKLIESPAETDALAKQAKEQDQTVLIPAFSGLSAPYWCNDAKAMLYGMTRTTGRNEIVKAALNSIALQIQAVLSAMQKDSGMELIELRVDGGPTRNDYLMQAQSNLSQLTVAISEIEELSALGAAYMAGISMGLYELDTLFTANKRKYYQPDMSSEVRQQILDTWEEAISVVVK
ncbi:MAG: glycerol kinase [Lachnospiraceae bacterium]|nr:glycerol kinase [Lachnospiraceae bacterium]